MLLLGDGDGDGDGDAGAGAPDDWDVPEFGVLDDAGAA